MLNDDCLLAIFKYVTLHDLVSFKEAYKSLGAAVDTEFSRRTRGSLDLGYKDNVDETLQIIKQFGTSIKDLKFKDVCWNSKIWDDVFTVMKEHCHETLQGLSLCGDGVESINMANIRSIADVLRNLNELRLDNRYDDVNNFILSYCVNVTSVTLVSNFDVVKHKTMFRQNVNLLKLKLFGPISADKLKIVVDNLVHSKLEELALKFTWSSWTNRDLNQTIRLKYLKRLSIGCMCTDIDRFLPNVNAFNSLDTLSLTNIQLNAKCIEALGRINKLKVLKLRCDCGQAASTTVNSHFDAVIVLCGNQSFEHLLLFCCKEVIDQRRFLQLVRKRRESTAERRLHLTLRHEIYTASLKAIPTGLLEANVGTLTLIDEWDRNYEHYSRYEYW